MNNIFNYIKNNWKICTSVFFGLIFISIIITIITPKSETVSCDNNKAIAQLQEQNIADLAKAADDFMIRQQGDDGIIVFANEIDHTKDGDFEYAKFHYSEETDSIKAEYNKSQALVENINKDINEVQCTIPVIFKGFSSNDKKATLTGIVQYTIHANNKGNVQVEAASLKNMFRSNFKPIYSNRQKKYFNFEYKTGTGETIDSINQLPLEEFGEFFNPLDY